MSSRQRTSHLLHNLWNRDKACQRNYWIKWRAPSERIRTASEIPIEADLTDEDAIPIYMRISEKVVHLRRLGMTYTNIAERLGINPWMAKKAVRWGNIQKT
jgi:hypothetical protein